MTHGVGVGVANTVGGIVGFGVTLAVGETGTDGVTTTDGVGVGIRTFTVIVMVVGLPPLTLLKVAE